MPDARHGVSLYDAFKPLVNASTIRIAKAGEKNALLEKSERASDAKMIVAIVSLMNNAE
ncbi:hypothetical protein X777_09186 [Ooceraea biroi]|uniref:Uncharacterized protein n=1 Tax=Ooceraea biroi TaxID=2015173 RepID=A0A026W7B5_OOCBI|nr:hypothetical protein X777_09186 [Ooceraea biroi]